MNTNTARIYVPEGSKIRIKTYLPALFGYLELFSTSKDAVGAGREGLYAHVFDGRLYSLGFPYEYRENNGDEVTNSHMSASDYSKHEMCIALSGLAHAISDIEESIENDELPKSCTICELEGVVVLVAQGIDAATGEECDYVQEVFVRTEDILDGIKQMLSQANKDTSCIDTIFTNFKTAFESELPEYTNYQIQTPIGCESNKLVDTRVTIDLPGTTVIPDNGNENNMIEDGIVYIFPNQPEGGDPLNIVSVENVAIGRKWESLFYEEHL